MSAATGTVTASAESPGTFVKICGITNREDALFAVAMGAEALGFVFAPSPRQVPVGRVRDIVDELPRHVFTVGVFRDEHPERVAEIVAEAGLRGAQLHGHETPRMVADVMARVKWVVKAVAAGSVEAEHADQYPTNLLLVDSATPGSGRTFDWSLVDRVVTDSRLILSGGLTADNVASAIARVRPWGVDVSSGVEREPGYKDPLRVKRFIDAVRGAGPTVT